MTAQIKVPEAGESVTRGVLVAWLKQDGDLVEADEPLFEVETDKITLLVNAPQRGVLKILVEAGQTVQIGQVVGTIELAGTRLVERGPTDRTTAPSSPPRPAVPPGPSPAPDVPAGPPLEPTLQQPPQAEGPPMNPPAGMPQARAKLQAGFGLDDLSPAVRRLVEEHGVAVGRIRGTGKDGRVTKEDVLRHLEQGEKADSGEAEPEFEPAQRPGPLGAPPGTPAAAGDQARQTRKMMSPLRQRIAERLVQAQHTAAMLTTFSEVDMTHLLSLRARYQQLFQEKHGIRLGFMSFFIKASVEALQSVPEVNAQIDGDHIITNHYYDIGVAVSTDRGLVVPVVRDADRLSFAQLERAVADLARRAQEKTLEMNDLLGAVFTISNGGVFGSLLSTPILNPPQSAILGMHAVKKRPVAVEERVEVRDMMYLALSYDHRLVDGREAVTFLKRIAECIENPERMMLEV